VPEDFVFPEVWRDLRGADAVDEAKRVALEAELIRELADGHVLAGVLATAMAKCRHCDDSLFALPAGRFAKVHLSYPKDAPDRPPWPRAEVFDDWSAAEAAVEEHAAWA
jgi:hypothetical protein